jgi:hypothetical protein
MPKKVSTMPVTKPAKSTRATVKAETDQSWSKLTNSGTPAVSKSTPKKQTKSVTPGKTTTSIQQGCNLTFSNDTDKFPHGGFPIRLEYKDNNDKKTCWFQCYNHFEKHITRYKITQYEAFTNDVALVGEVTGAKSKRLR